MIDAVWTGSATRWGFALLALGCAAASTPAASTPAAGGTSAATIAAGAKASGPTQADVLAAASPADFRTPDPENTLYLELASGRVVMELAPRFAPRHVANVKALAREGYYDGLSIVRVHENYVVQWADPDGQRPIRSAQRTLPAELERPAAEL